jgi:hypothetical protein
LHRAIICSTVPTPLTGSSQRPGFKSSQGGGGGAGEGGGGGVGRGGVDSGGEGGGDIKHFPQVNSHSSL